MASTKTPLPNPIGANIYRVAALGATQETNITGAASTLYRVQIDNRNNTAASYLKIYDSASAITVGTTRPVRIIKAPASKRVVRNIARGVGQALANGLTAACVTAAGTGGTTSPTANVEVLFHV